MSKSLSNKNILGTLTVNSKTVPTITNSDTPPSSPYVNDMWLRTTDMTMFVYYSDGTSSQWTEIRKADETNLGTRVTALEGTRSVSIGGTGATTLSSGGYLKGNGTSAITSQTGIPATDITSGALDVARGGTGSTTGAGLIPRIPTSVTVGSGSASIDSNGIVTVTGNASYIALNGVFSSAYKNYRIKLFVAGTTNDTYIFVRLRSSGTDITSNYYSGGYQGWSNSTSGTWAAANAAYFYAGLQASLSNGPTVYDIELYNPYEATYTKGTSLGLAANSTNGIGAQMVGLANFNSNVCDGITILMNGGNVSSGSTIRVYGYN